MPGKMKIMYYKQDKIDKIRKFKLTLSQWFFDGFWQWIQKSIYLINSFLRL